MNKRSFTNSPILYLVGTPIGNLEDISLRALRILREVSKIYCEDTRTSSVLLRHYDISTPLESYHNFNEESKAKAIVEYIKAGHNVALISDAGNPIISDPGFKLVRECKEKDLKVIPICGASAVLSALVASGLASEHFLFYGFLSEKENERRKDLEKLSNIQYTIIIYESPKRIMYTLNEILNIIGNIDICVAREITKIHEDIKTDKVLKIIDYYKNNEDKLRGEFVIILRPEKNFHENIDVEKIKIIYNNLKSYMKPKDIADFIVKIGIYNNKKEIYNILLTF